VDYIAKLAFQMNIFAKIKYKILMKILGRTCNGQSIIIEKGISQYHTADDQVGKQYLKSLNVSFLLVIELVF